MDLLVSSPSTSIYLYSIPGTPTSQQFAASNQSDSLSPLEVNNFTSPTQDQDLQYVSSANPPVHTDGNSVAPFPVRQSYLDQQKSSPQMADSDMPSHGQKRDASSLDSVLTEHNSDQQQSLAPASTSPPPMPTKTRQTSSTGSPEDACKTSDAAAATRVRTTDSAK
ncbi:hypothetical protein E4T44_14886, partial [Aureobasidium sp. EXF-8845]